MAYPTRLTPPPIPPPYENNISYRLSKVEEQAEELEVEKRKLSDAVLLLGIQIQSGLAELSARIKHFEERKTFWNRVLIGIISAGAIAIISHLLHLSYIVQTNRASGGV